MTDSTPTLTTEQQEALTWAIAEVGCIHTGGVDHDAITGCRDCQDIAGAVEPLIARMVADAEQRGRAEALRAAADAWTQGAWSDVMLPKPSPPAVPVIAYSNRMGDWLRDRADRIGGAPDA